MIEQLLQPTLPDAQTDGKAMRAVLVILSLCGVGMALLCTARYGIGTTPDSASYLSAARSLLAGRGYLCFDNRVYAQWPPLFPTSLALFGAVGVEPLTGARLLNSAAFGAIIFISGNLFIRSTVSKTFAIMGTLSVVFSVPLLTVSTMTWSEPVFVVLALLFALLLARFLQRPNLPMLLWVSVVTALACLQRYAGVSLIMAGSVLIALGASKASLWQRLKYLVIFGVLSATPLALWLLRNNLAGATVGGHSFRPPAMSQLTRSFLVGAETLAPWFFTSRAPNSVKGIGVGLILILTTLLIVVSRLRFRDRDPRRMTRIGIAVVVAGIYFGFLATSAAGLRWDPEPRLMAPLYVFVMILVAAGAEAGLRLLGTVTGRKGPVTAGVVLCGLWLLYPLTETHQMLAHCLRHGAGGYSAAAWQDAPMMQWLRNHPLHGIIYSNVPDAIYILTGATAEITPHHYWTAADRAKRMAESQAPNEYVAWSHYRHWEYLYDLRELLSLYDMEEIVSFPDGKVYRLLGEADGPPVYGVYRFWSPATSKHVYTADKGERDRLLAERSQAWAYEGSAFHVYLTPEPETVGVHRFRLIGEGTDFYTINEEEYEKLTVAGSRWTYEGVVFYVYPEKVRDDLSGVHRFWSDRLSYHFYTASENEKDTLCDDPTGTWIYEGIAWYAYGAP